jgi:uncharacterized protein (DUF302 family)
MPDTKIDYTVESSRTVDEAAAEVERLTAENGYRVLATHDVAATLASKGFEREPMKIVEICNAKHAHDVLAVDPKISLMLPCPISVYAQGGQTYISMMLPTMLAGFFPGDKVKSVSEQVEATMKEIIDQAR